MEIIKREAIVSIHEFKEEYTNLQYILNYFMHNNDEILYFVANDSLKAVVSIGDIFRFLENKTKTEVLNYNFTWVAEKDFKNAQIFFRQHPTIHELPIVDSSGRFVGIVKSGAGNTENVWNGFRNHANKLYYIGAYYEKQASKFMKHFKGTVLLMDLPDDGEVVRNLKSDEERGEYSRKRNKSALMHLNTMTEQEARSFWGEMYEPGISKRFAKEFVNIKVSENNGCKYYSDGSESKYITFENGKRKVINKSENAKHNIYLVGPCTIFGAYVTDNQTVEYYLQKLINESCHPYQVVNYGALGPGYEFQYLLTEPMDESDIVVIAARSKQLISIMNRFSNAYYIGNCFEIFNNLRQPVSCILDTFRHINYKISEELAKWIYASIKLYLSDNSINEKKNAITPIQNYFISLDIVKYYKEFVLSHNLDNLQGVVGAIVMNCNPFTKGHRYLIEYAASKVDTLIVFVVEEDASVFPFDDRIKMVKLGTKDIKNVKVVPSGKYNISKSTFAQYFDKEKQIDKVDSMEYDLRIFCEVIAESMNISCRFVGEEPADIVTKQYNETMKNILPQYHIELVEIPRLRVNEANESECISASLARKYIKQGNWAEVSKYLPETTINYLKHNSI